MTEATDNKTLRSFRSAVVEYVRGPFYVQIELRGSSESRQVWRIDDSKNPPAPVFEGSLPSLSSIEQEIDTELDSDAAYEAIKDYQMNEPG